MVVFGSASFVEDHSECRVIHYKVYCCLLYFKQYRHTRPCNLWPSSCKVVVVLCAVYAYRLCTSVMHNFESRCRRMIDIRAT